MIRRLYDAFVSDVRGRLNPMVDLSKLDAVGIDPLDVANLHKWFLSDVARRVQPAVIDSAVDLALAGVPGPELPNALHAALRVNRLTGEPVYEVAVFLARRYAETGSTAWDSHVLAWADRW